MRKYHHLGIPTTEKREGEVWHEHLKLGASGYDESEFHIEWVRFADDAPYPDLVKTVPHICFEVNDLEEALKGKTVIIAPNSPSAGVKVAFIDEGGAPVELIEVDRSIAQEGI
ncbi:Uncharacterised protein [BD1-7 clade bacterium]|uniref:VOC domain-containing protein n=1 Tax=BD1-7 clade bacterium TaxID=2029982 RepID=A0A5S9QH97_9GAMM|nr:Uncharacterised protein [BD1-7 clade bacterium]CAA0117540.1 Uncharacterised protein [BD1-7 clade bacterium]